MGTLRHLALSITRLIHRNPLYDWIMRVTPIVEGENCFPVELYGAKGDGVTDDAAAFRRASAAIQANGTGYLCLRSGANYAIKMPPGSVATNGTNASVLATLTGCVGVGVVCNGLATITDLSTYRATAPVQAATFVRFVTCSNVLVSGVKLISQDIITPGSPNTTGLTCFEYFHGCRNIQWDTEHDGCLYGHNVVRLASDSPATFTSENIRGRTDAVRTYYPNLLGRSGNNAELYVTHDKCGRAIFLYGVHNVRATTIGKNLKTAILVAAFGGDGCSDIDLTVYDRDSTDANVNAIPVLIGYQDHVPATHRNITVNLDVKNDATGLFFGSVMIDKAGNDTVGRGHVLSGLTVRGTSDQANGRPHIATVGTSAFAFPDLVERVDVEISGTGIGSMIGPLAFGDALRGGAFFRNTSTESSFDVTNSTGRVILDGSRAAGSLNNSAADNSPQSFRDSLATNGASNSYHNKELVATRVGDRFVGFSAEKAITVAQDATFDLSTYGKDASAIANEIAILMISRDGGRAYIIALLGGNHTTIEIAPSVGYSAVLGTPGLCNVGWDGAKYVLENKQASGPIDYSLRFFLHSQV